MIGLNDNNSRSLRLPHTRTLLIDKLIGINLIGACRNSDIGTLFYWIFVIFTEIFENGSLIYWNGRAANRLYKRYFSATGGRITCMPSAQNRERIDHSRGLFLHSLPLAQCLEIRGVNGILFF